MSHDYDLCNNGTNDAGWTRILLSVCPSATIDRETVAIYAFQGDQTSTVFPETPTTLRHQSAKSRATAIPIPIARQRLSSLPGPYPVQTALRSICDKCDRTQAIPGRYFSGYGPKLDFAR
jgi:hypothetical protein